MSYLGKQKLHSIETLILEMRVVQYLGVSNGSKYIYVWDLGK